MKKIPTIVEAKPSEEKHGPEFDGAEVVDVHKPDRLSNFYGLTPRTEAGKAILLSLFGTKDNTWLGDTLYVDQRYVSDVIEIVGTRIKFL